MGPLGLCLSIVWLLLNVFIIHITFVSCKISVMSRGNETDRLSLLEFKDRVKDPLRVLRSWNDSIHHCEWHGVTCGRRHQRVTILSLRSQKLVGSISPHVGNLSFLLILDLRNNTIIDVIPPELGRLRRLRFLILVNNTMTGVIPANIFNCSNLVSFVLSSNNLEGEIPVEIGSLSKLERLYFDNNNLTGGIPPTLGSLSKLGWLYIDKNKLTGRIPPSLGNLSSLQYISTSSNVLSESIPDAFGKLGSLKVFLMRNNLFTGTLPPLIFNLSSIIAFDVSYNQIQGILPSNLGNILPNIKFLSVSVNNFTGLVPASISNATNLVQLFFGRNKLIGKVPGFGKLHKLERLNFAENLFGANRVDDLSFFSSLTNASNLNFLVCGSNNFGGMIPMSVGNLSTSLQFLAIPDNRIIGTLPIGLFNLVHLHTLVMEFNHFTGSIPTEIGKLRELQVLAFSRNEFDGNIPSSMGNLTMLTSLYLQNNNLQGNIPSSLGECQKLLYMDLSQNNLIGKIPSEILRISSLSISLLLSDNKLFGPLPTDVGSLKNLGELDISRNMLSGEIPSTLGSCLSLEVLSMGGNNFQGIIPSSLRDLRGLRRLDLSSNNLSGRIPNYLEGFDLQYLNLSFNDFDGAVPREGIFKNHSAIFINGNNKLCGDAPELNLSRCNIEGSKKRKLSFTLKLSISIVLGGVGLGLLLCFLFFYWSKSSKKDTSSDSLEKSIFKASYQMLLKATDGFSSSNMIGAGSFGSVYKGVLDHAETIVAIKVLNLSRQGALKSFISECEALRNMRHRNLVKIITACSGVDYQGNDFKALIYEFMVNGSLDKWLHPCPGDDEIPEKLNFLQRLNVSIDVAYALDYLHHGYHVSMVHCDLKPSNVLLDNEMIAHVSDFGLAKFIQEGPQNSTTNQASSVVGIRGTIGYTAPEYGMGSEVSTNGDVYSYGILVLEMFTGKRPTDVMFKDRENLHNYAQNALPDRVTEVVDQSILPEIEEDNDCIESSSRSHRVEECLISIIRIGVACSSELARERMSMNDVASQLHAIKDKFLGIGIHRH